MFVNLLRALPTRCLLCLGLVLLTAACVADSDSLVSAGPTPSESLAGMDVGLSDIRSFDVYADGGALHLLVAGKVAQKDVPQLRYMRSGDGGLTWAGPFSINTESTPPTVSKRGNDVQVAAVGTQVVAVWQTGGEFPGMGPMASAYSIDSGQTWIGGSSPADGDSRRDQGYMDLAGDQAGRFHIVWLDDREESGNYQGLRYARTMDGGRHWGTDETLDDKTCTCCWTAMDVSSGRTVRVLYRDAEPHDMALTQSTDQDRSWQRLGSVGNFDWRFLGCPHTGGGLAVVEDDDVHLHSVVWTGADASMGFYHLRSGDLGRNWAAPTRLGGDTAVHGDVAAMDRDRIAAVWDAVGETGSAVFAALSTDGGRTWSEPRALSNRDVNATHPRILATGLGFRAFWTQRGEDRTAIVVSAALPLSGDNL